MTKDRPDQDPILKSQLMDSIDQCVAKAMSTAEALEAAISDARAVGAVNLTLRMQRDLLRRHYRRKPPVLRAEEARHSDVPRLGKFILLCVLSKKARESLPGDLAEEFAEIERTFGLRRARFWYWCQVVRPIGRHSVKPWPSADPWYCRRLHRRWRAPQGQREGI